MAIINTGDFPIDPTTVDGDVLAERLNREALAVFSNNAHTTRPDYITAGGLWTKKNGIDLEVYLYNGTSDFLIGGIVNGQIVNGGAIVHTSATEPTHFKIGDFWLNGDVLSLRTLNDWLQVNSAQQPIGSLMMFSHAEPEPGYFELDGSTVAGGAINPAYQPLINSNCAFITISNDDFILHDAPDFLRSSGASGRAVGSFESDAIRNITGESLGLIVHTHGSGQGRIGAIETLAYSQNSQAIISGTLQSRKIFFNASWVVPTADENRPKSLTVSARIYHGVI